MSVRSRKSFQHSSHSTTQQRSELTHMRRYMQIGILFGLQIFLMAGMTQVALGNTMEASTPPAAFLGSGSFETSDLDRDGQPDHLAYTISVDAKTAGEYWLSAELQTLVHGEWQTLNYTAVPFDWLPGRQDGRILFYGGEIERHQVEGPSRVVANLRIGGWETASPHLQNAPEINDISWQDSNVAAADGPVNTASEAVRLARTWAEREQKELGPLADRSFAFDRWRIDFSGTEQQPPRRVWVDPSGDISAVDRKPPIE